MFLLEIGFVVFIVFKNLFIKFVVVTSIYNLHNILQRWLMCVYIYYTHTYAYMEHGKINLMDFTSFKWSRKQTYSKRENPLN